MNSQYKELSDKAFYYHQRGELEKALSIYNALLKIEPDDANILNLTGLIYLASGDSASAAESRTARMRFMVSFLRMDCFLR